MPSTEFFAASGGAVAGAHDLTQVDLDQYTFWTWTQKQCPGPFRRGAHEETSDRMKSARVGILILILVICGAVKPRSIQNLVASATAAAEPKRPERATKVKGADEANRRLMALSEEDR